jgi:hypothetical protein
LDYCPRLQLQVLISLPLDNNPHVLCQFAELVNVFNQIMPDQNLWAEIIHLKTGIFFLIIKVN